MAAGTIDVIVGSQEGEVKVPRDLIVPLAAMAGGIEALVRIAQSRPAAGLALGALRGGVVGGAPGAGAAGISMAALSGRESVFGGIRTQVSQTTGGFLEKVFRAVFGGLGTAFEEALSSVKVLSDISVAREAGIDQIGVAFSAIRRGGAPLPGTNAIRNQLDKAKNAQADLSKKIRDAFTVRDPVTEIQDTATREFKQMFDAYNRLKDQFLNPDERQRAIRRRSPLSAITPQRRSQIEEHVLQNEIDARVFDESLKRLGRSPDAGDATGRAIDKTRRDVPLTPGEMEIIKQGLQNFPASERRGIEENVRERARLGVGPKTLSMGDKPDSYLDKVRKALDESEPVDEGTLANSWIWPISNNFYS